MTGLARGVLSPGNNVAWQATPFWLAQHLDLSARDIQASPWASWYRDMTVSIATAQATVQRADATGAVTDLAMNRIALGARTTVYPGDPSTEALVCERVLDQYTLEGAVAFNADAVKFQAEFEKSYPKPPSGDIRGRRGGRLTDYSYYRRLTRRDSGPCIHCPPVNSTVCAKQHNRIGRSGSQHSCTT